MGVGKKGQGKRYGKVACVGLGGGGGGHVSKGKKGKTSKSVLARSTGGGLKTDVLGEKTWRCSLGE